jgi:hypothetical protein
MQLIIALMLYFIGSTVEIFGWIPLPGVVWFCRVATPQAWSVATTLYHPIGQN